MSRFDNFVLKESDSIYSLYARLKKGYIKEQKETTDKNVVILTNRAEKNDEEKFHTAQRLEDECKKKNIPSYVLFAENSHIMRDDDGNYTVHNYDDDKGFPIDPDTTVAMSRGSVMRKNSTRNLISQLERANIFCVNNRKCIEICADKYRSILKIVDAGLPAPKTVMIQDMDTLDYAIEQMDSNFPYVIKTLSGSKGVGVFFVESERSLTSILQTIWKINEDEELIIQEYIEAPFDIRVHTLGDEVIAAMRRDVIEGDFRSNYSQGGKVSPFKVNKELAEVCVKAAKAVGATWAGVDVIMDKKGNPYIIEINSSPGTEGIEKATKINVPEKVLEYCLDDDNWKKTAKEIGYKEVVEIMGTKIKAKFDTGNGSLCVMHAKSFDIDEKKKIVKWSFDDKKFKHTYIDIKKVNVGGLRDYEEDRPVIELDIIFDGVKYKDVKFTLDDRTGRIPVLINRNFMRKANIAVNPRDKYTITIPDEVDE